MKIYCDRYEPCDFSRFIGKDAWVKCHRFNENGSFISDVYIKVLGPYMGSHYYASVLRASFVDDPSTYTVEDLSGLREYVDSIHCVDIYDFSIISPLEIYTTDELLDLLGCNKT